MSDNDNTDNSPPRKKKTYYCSFQEQWLSKYSWVRKESDFNISCKVCNIKFTFKYDGDKALSRHAASAKHVGLESAKRKNDVIQRFFPKVESAEDEKIATIELANIYHAVSHHLSYNSFDCGMKLICHCFSDSKFSKQIHCGRTKAEAVVKNVLMPFAIEEALKEIKGEASSSASDTPLFFSLATDASNKGSRKFFPVVLFYFHPDSGLQNKVLDFFEEADETSNSIYHSLKDTLNKLGLSVNRIIAFSGDNAAVNFGKKNSVFIHLKAENSKMLKGNCHAHILHNCGKFAVKRLSYDVEALVLKIYSEFSTSAKKVTRLKECFDEAEMEYQKILKHGSTRWLSLYESLDRLLMSWPAVKQYFLVLGVENCPKIISDFIGNQENEPTNDLTPEVSFQECYLYFVHHFMNIFRNSILILQSKTFLCLQLHDIMINIRSELISKRDDKFFGFKTNQAMQRLSYNEKKN